MWQAFLWSSTVWTTVKAQRERQNCELECESKETTLDGNGPEVEIVAQDGSPMDRDVQHERSFNHKRERESTLVTRPGPSFRVHKKE